MRKLFKKLRERLWLARDDAKTKAIGAVGQTATKSIWNRYPRTAHFAYDAIAPLLLLSIPLNFLTLHGWAWKSVAALFVETMQVLILMGIFHRGFLCEHCIGKFPLDGQARAAKRCKQLYSAHYRVKWFLLTWVSLWVADLAGPSMGLKGVWLSVALSILGLPGPYWFWRIFRTHDRLQPFCPYCKGGGGEHEHAPDPDPSEMVPA